MGVGAVVCVLAVPVVMNQAIQALEGRASADKTITTASQTVTADTDASRQLIEGLPGLPTVPCTVVISGQGETLATQCVHVTDGPFFFANLGQGGGNGCAAIAFPAPSDSAVNPPTGYSAPWEVTTPTGFDPLPHGAPLFVAQGESLYVIDQCHNAWVSGYFPY
jgi:hypothetical protein